MTGPMVTPDRETLATVIHEHHPMSLWGARKVADALLASGAVTTAADAVRAWAEDETLVERVWALADKRTTAEVTQILRALAAALGGES